MEGIEQARLIESALDLGVRQRFGATTLDQVAAAAGVTPEVARGHFATTADIMLAVYDVLLLCVLDALADQTTDDNLVEALLLANAKALDDIILGIGLVTRDRLAAFSYILNGSPELQSLTSARRREVLGAAIAGKLGVSVDDRRVRRTITTWSAVVAAAYNPHPGLRLRVDPTRDARVPELMDHCLRESYRRITGQNLPRGGETTTAR